MVDVVYHSNLTILQVVTDHVERQFADNGALMEVPALRLDCANARMAGLEATVTHPHALGAA